MTTNTTRTREPLTYFGLISKERDENNKPRYMQWVPLPCSSKEIAAACRAAFRTAHENGLTLDPCYDGGIAEYWVWNISNVFEANRLLQEAETLGSAYYDAIDKLVDHHGFPMRQVLDRFKNRT